MTTCNTEVFAGTPSYVSASVRDSLRKNGRLYTMKSPIFKSLFKSFLPVFQAFL